MIADTLRSRPIALISVTPDDAIRAALPQSPSTKHAYADPLAAALAGNQNLLVRVTVEHFERVPKLRLLNLGCATRT